MEDWWQKYHKSIAGFIGKRVADEGVVEELTNDVMLAAIKSRPMFNKKCSEFSFICSIAKHKIIDYYRKKKLKTILFSVSEKFEEVADAALTPERDVLKNELKEEIKKTLAEIGEGSKELLRLKYVDGRRIAEIASMFKLSLKAVESRLTRAKKKFRQAWVYDQKKI